MFTPGKIKIEEYNYQLQDERIAKYPLAKRDASKLLYFNDGSPNSKLFSVLPDLLPENSFLIFNETRVIQARLKFRKSTGATIEIFCLEPHFPTNDFQLAFQQNSPVVWKCMIGNAKRWKSGRLSIEFEFGERSIVIEAEIKERLSDSWLVEFTWNEDIKFHEIIEYNGLTPLPPYLNREAEESDKNRYQTVYAHYDGSVAAPTAGLHFTDKIISELRAKGIEQEKLTLHVGAGTFKPVSAEQISDHEMHSEHIIVSLNSLENIKANLQKNKTIIPVGTTSMRSLESLFWMALRLEKGDESMQVDQWDPYKMEIADGFDTIKALDNLINYLKDNERESLSGETRLMIAPGYDFKFANGLITNFHQPKSTLLLLVSALIGEKWKLAYNYAMENNFRFLSYGDSCLFLK